MVYTRKKKKDLNDQLLAQLPDDITAPYGTHYDADTARIFLHLSSLPKGAFLVESTEELREQSMPGINASHTPVVVVFVAVNHLINGGETTTRYMADYVLPGHENEQIQRIAARRLYTWQPPKSIIYKGIVY